MNPILVALTMIVVFSIVETNKQLIVVAIINYIKCRACRTPDAALSDLFAIGNFK